MFSGILGHAGDASNGVKVALAILVFGFILYVLFLYVKNNFLIYSFPTMFLGKTSKAPSVTQGRLDTNEKKRLLIYSRIIYVYKVLAILGAMFFGKLAAFPEEMNSDYAIALVFWFTALSLGLQFRPAWARFFAILSYAILLGLGVYAFISNARVGFVLLLVSIPALLTVIKGKKLFGENKITSKALKASEFEDNMI